jgi:uncharacterized membrane protein HdeD (DUF308 family)
MFTNSPIYFRVRTVGQNVAQRGSWLVMAPGLALILLALAIFVWPELLAYLVGSAILFAGVVLSLWGWTMRRAERHLRSQQTVYYDVHP